MRRVLIVVLGLAALAGCSAGGAPTAATPVPASGTAFEQALARMDGPFGGRVDFVDSHALGEAAAAGGPWEQLVGGTGGSLDTYRGPLADVLGIDLARADMLVATGNPPQRVTLVAGGQDEERVRAAAAAAGWTGDGDLHHDFTVEQPLSIVAGALRPRGADVVVGGPEATLDLVDGSGPTLAQDAPVAAITNCLGDVVVGVVTGGATPDGPLRGVGLRRDPAAPAGPPLTVLCVVGDSTTATTVEDAVRTGTSLRTGEPYAQYLADPRVEQLPGSPPLVRMTAQTPPGGPTTFVLQALESGDLPGLAE
ncbi:hypothetical protein BJF78_09330 [Pseudonocardia sp. CNS-139]|nr:hypothetical protein BJF78_09330 [Pseudonocardia sp. CNS-139]